MHRLTQALKQALDAQLNAATTGNAAVADRHFRFLVGQLAIGTVGLAAFPVWLTLDPGGSSISSVAFLWLLAPLATIVFVLKTGRLQLGQMFASLALTGLVCWLALKTGGAPSPFVVLLAAVPLSVRLTGSEGSLREATIIAFAGLGLMVALSAFGAIGHPLDWVSSSPTLVVAGVAVGLVGFWRARGPFQGQQYGELPVSLIDEGGDLITRHDDGGDVVAASQMARELLGVEPDELHGRGMAALVNLEDRVRFDEALHQACSGEATVRIRYRIRVAGTPLARNELVETTFRRSNARLPSPSIVGVTRTVHSADRQPPSSGFAENKEAEAALETMVGFADLLSDPRLVRAGSQEWRSYANLMRVSGEQLAAALRGSGDSGSRDHGLPVEGGSLFAAARKAIDLANAAGAGCPVEIATGAADAAVGMPEADSTRLILCVLLTLRRQMPADGVLAVSIGEREKRARLEIKAVAPQPFVQRRTTYNSQASIVDLGLMESAEITAKWGGDLSIESPTRFGPVVVLELPKARPDSGGQHHSEEQWGEVRKSA